MTDLHPSCNFDNDALELYLPRCHMQTNHRATKQLMGFSACPVPDVISKHVLGHDCSG